MLIFSCRMRIPTVDITPAIVECKKYTKKCSPLSQLVKIVVSFLLKSFKWPGYRGTWVCKRVFVASPSELLRNKAGTYREIRRLVRRYLSRNINIIPNHRVNGFSGTVILTGLRTYGRVCFVVFCCFLCFSCCFFCFLCSPLSLRWRHRSPPQAPQPILSQRVPPSGFAIAYDVNVVFIAVPVMSGPRLRKIGS